LHEVGQRVEQPVREDHFALQAAEGQPLAMVPGRPGAALAEGGDRHHQAVADAIVIVGRARVADHRIVAELLQLDVVDVVLVFHPLQHVERRHRLADRAAGGDGLRHQRAHLRQQLLACRHAAAAAFELCPDQVARSSSRAIIVSRFFTAIFSSSHFPARWPRLPFPHGSQRRFDSCSMS
jgi:hypothetical protein